MALIFLLSTLTVLFLASFFDNLIFFFLLIPQPPRSTLFPYTTLFRSVQSRPRSRSPAMPRRRARARSRSRSSVRRSEEHTSELQSPDHLVCRLLLEKKNRTVASAPRAWRPPPTKRLSALDRHRRPRII